MALAPQPHHPGRNPGAQQGDHHAHKHLQADGFPQQHHAPGQGKTENLPVQDRGGKERRADQGRHYGRGRIDKRAKARLQRRCGEGQQSIGQRRGGQARHKQGPQILTQQAQVFALEQQRNQKQCPQCHAQQNQAYGAELGGRHAHEDERESPQRGKQEQAEGVGELQSVRPCAN